VRVTLLDASKIRDDMVLRYLVLIIESIVVSRHHVHGVRLEVLLLPQYVLDLSFLFFLLHYLFLFVGLFS